MHPYESGGVHELCVLCRNDLVEGENVKELKCTHEYHEECVNEWLREHRECPDCGSPAV